MTGKAGKRKMGEAGGLRGVKNYDSDVVILTAGGSDVFAEAPAFSS
jgi:hypothetical protein